MTDEQKPAETPRKETMEIATADWRKIQRQLRETQELAATLATERDNAEKLLNGGVLPHDEQPEYELSQPYYSPDDVYYPEGFIIRDVRGDITPNEFMIPRNEAAQLRYEHYMTSLPTAGGRQPTISEVIDAASRAMRELGPTASGDQIQAAITAAIVSGLSKSTPIGRQPSLPNAQLRPRGDVPLMPNTNITSVMRPAAPTAPKRGPARTRAVGQAPDPTAPVMGSVQSQPLSTLPA